MASTYHTQIQKLYVAYFNRPADFLGLDYWEGVVERAAAAAGTDPVKVTAAVDATLAAISGGFSASAEYQAEYAGLDTEHVVGQVYQNLFGHAPDLPGLIFWSNAIRAGHVTIASAVTQIAAGAQGSDLVAFNNKVTAATAFTNALDTGAEVLAYSGEEALAAGNLYIAGVTDDASLAAAIAPATLNATIASIVEMANPAPVGTTFNLTTGADTFSGTAGNDIFNGVVGTAAGLPSATMSVLDQLNGGIGADTLNIVDQIGGIAITGVNTNSIETVVVRSVAAANVDTSAGFAGVTQLNITQASTVTAVAGAETGVAVSGATGDVAVDGGSTVSVVSAASGADVTIGATTSAAGAISVTHSKVAAGAIAVDGGTSVNVAASGVTTGTINVGQAGDLPTGAITVSATGAATAANVDATRGAITVDGGTTVTVNQTATSSAAAADEDTDGATITQGAINVNGGSKTTAVTINQTAAAEEFAFVEADAGKLETNVVTFSAVTAGQTVTVNGLSFTSTKALTAEKVAAAFVNLTSGATQGSAPASDGIYSGTATAGFTSAGSTAIVVGAVTTYSVTFTATSAATNPAAMGVAGPGVTVVNTDGEIEVEGEEAQLGVVAGTVTVVDSGDDTIATVTVNGFGAGSAITSDALATLNLANSNADLTITNTVAKTLNLSLDAVGGFTSAGATDSAVVNAGATYTTVNLTTTGTNSIVDLSAAGAKALTVAGSKSVNLTGATLTALETITVSGSAGLTIDADQADTLTSINASGTTGSVTAVIDAAIATYTGSAGTDSLTLSTTTITKAIDLGAGDDTLTLATGTTASTPVLTGGAGTDTLSLAAADAAALSTATTFETKVEGFEKLRVGAVAQAAANVVDLANLDDINYVIVAGGATTGAVSEVQTVAVTGAATGQVSFLGTAVTGSANLDDAATTAGLIVADKAALIAAWNLANPTLEITNISNVGADLTITYANTEGNVAALGATASAGINFGAGVETTAGVAAAGATGTLTLKNMANAGTVEMIGAGTGAIVTMTDATGAADSLNVIVKNGNGINAGTVDAAGVETINLTVTDTTTTTINTQIVNVKDAALTTLNVTGNSHVNVTLDAANVALTSIDATALTGKLNVATNAAATAATTVKGGTAADTLTANHNGDVLQGNAGADVLIVKANLVTLTGGAGNDTFNVSFATANVNSYATITDLAKGDKIQFAASGSDFMTSKVSLADTAVFQDFANAAINSTDVGDISWFQIAGNTYVIQNVNDGTSFTNGTDVIVKITGLVDLSTASYSSTADLLVIG